MFGIDKGNINRRSKSSTFLSNLINGLSHITLSISISDFVPTRNSIQINFFKQLPILPPREACCRGRAQGAGRLLATAARGRAKMTLTPFPSNINSKLAQSWLILNKIDPKVAFSLINFENGTIGAVLVNNTSKQS